MYYTLTVSRTHIAGLTLIKGASVGIAAALFSSVIPALDAAATRPVTLMQAPVRQTKFSYQLAWPALAGGLLLAISLSLFSWKQSSTGLVFLGIFMLFAGASLVCPALISAAVSLASGTVKWLDRTGLRIDSAIALMGIRNISRSLSRTAVLIASLMVVVSVYIGIDTMTRSFRLSIEEWVDGHIGGDIHISSLDELNPGLDISVLEGVTAMDPVKAVSAYNIHKNFSSRSGEVHLFSYLKDLSEKKWQWLAPEAGPDGIHIDSLMNQGWILVSEILARQHDLLPDSGNRPVRVTMDTAQGEKTFPVAGVFRDFFMGGGRAVVSRELMKEYWGKDEVTSIQLFVSGRDAEEKETTVRQMISAIRERHNGSGLLRIRSGSEIKQSILAVFDKTFLITTALQFLTALVALTGIVNSIMALILERSRELAVLRACGAEPFQVRRLILWESGACGFMAGGFALPLGILLSWVLIDVVNFRAFGWTYDMRLSWLTMAQALGFSFAAALGSGLIPAFRAGNISVARALRTE